MNSVPERLPPSSPLSESLFEEPSDYETRFPFQDPDPTRLDRRPRNRPLLHLVLFLATVLSTTYVGSSHYARFASDFGPDLPDVSIFQGAWYSLTIIAILGFHEMGHYLACRYYRVEASLPLFLPAPIVLTGTFGAVIRIRGPIPAKRMLFDIGAAGPIAGFVVAVPALVVGLWMSRVVPLPEEGFDGIMLGEPLLFQFVAWLIWGGTPDGYTINLHPVGLAAWFGLLVTAINLFPIAQLDGGHISYAALGRRSTMVTLVSTVCIVALAMVVSLSWLFWAVMMIIMLFIFGPRHPPTMDDHLPLDRTRRWIAVGTMVIFVLCFTPAPVEVMDIITP